MSDLHFAGALGQPWQHAATMTGMSVSAPITSYISCAWQVEPCGGGSIIHEADTNEIRVTGSSSRYGEAEHTKAAELVRRFHPFHAV
eukprot:7170909-Pyramimonas_sp.AAC.1